MSDPPYADAQTETHPAERELVRPVLAATAARTAPARDSIVARLRRWSPWLLLVSGSIAFRLPVLMNAGAVNSDAAVVGLQARHMLKGEWAPFLWGAGYQSSLDAVMVALGFAVAGFGPLTLAVVPLIAHLIFTWLAWDLLRKRLGDWRALAATLPLVFTPMAVNIAFVYVARQWCIVTVFFSIWLLDGASESKRSIFRYAAGAVAIFLALCMDLFALQFTVGLGLLALACLFDGRFKFSRMAARSGALLAGIALGYAIFAGLRSTAGAASGNTLLTFDRLKPNFELLKNICLPWTLSLKIFANFKTIWTEEWVAPDWFQWVERVGAAILVLGFFFAAASIVVRRIPWRIRRLAFAGAVVAASSIGGFLVSIAPADFWSCRYLSPIIYMAPFALAPAAYLLRARRFFALIAPYVVSVAVAGWVSYGILVDGPLPKRARPGVAKEEAEVARVLHSKGVHYGAAQYWLAYRLTFLFAEDPIIVPLSAGQDRYASYRQGFDKAATVAYIFHPEEPRATAGQQEYELRAAGTPYERLEIDGFTVLVAQRRQ